LVLRRKGGKKKFGKCVRLARGRGRGEGGKGTTKKQKRPRGNREGGSEVERTEENRRRDPLFPENAGKGEKRLDGRHDQLLVSIHGEGAGVLPLLRRDTKKETTKTVLYFEAEKGDGGELGGHHGGPT